MSERITRDFVRCACGERGNAINRRANSAGQTTSDFSFEVVHESPDREHTVRCYWDRETMRYVIEQA